jgi:formiminoglutamase
VAKILQTEAASVFWGLDMDVVRAADAPGVSAPNPLGMSGEELCLLAELAGAEPRSRLLEISELNPAYDIDGRTARLAAAAIWHFLMARAVETQRAASLRRPD